MKLFTTLLPIVTALLLLYFFASLPNLNTCVLPGPGRSPASRRLSRGDALPILALTLLYALTAFYRLGSLTDPQSFEPMEGREAVITLPEGVFPSMIMLYPGVGQGGYDIAYSEDGVNYETVESFSQDHVAVLKWASLCPSTTLRPRYLRISCTYGQPWLGEVVVLDGDWQPAAVSCDLPALCDEPDTVPGRISFQNSSYFDEIYHARTAWEHLNGVWPYEITHPPLGKEIMGLGILLFGMTPFGWRFSGTLFGVLMLPLLYIFLKKLFGGRWVPTLGTLLFATDFMHYTQTRIATIDTYSVFFILLMYLFLYLWLTEDKLWALALCGVSFGLGAAAKWTSIYAGLGLAFLWAAKWGHRFLAARPSPDRHCEEGEARRGNPSPPVFPAFVRNSLFCVAFFILVPVAIYFYSYLPYGAARGVGRFSRDYLRIVLDNQSYMFTYHSQSVLGATHPYSSVWTQWLLDIRPILYVLEYPTAATKISIAAWLNPVLCWGGLLSLPVLGWMALVRRDRRAAFLLVGYLSQLLPWVGITRLTFAYHYFPSALFLALSLGYILALLRENEPRWKLRAIGLAGGSALLFVLFFPALNGLEVNRDLATALMKWFDTWPL